MQALISLKVEAYAIEEYLWIECKPKPNITAWLCHSLTPDLKGKTQACDNK